MFTWRSIFSMKIRSTKAIRYHIDGMVDPLKEILEILYRLALRSGITVASEVHPRRGYCWLKTFPNTPQDGLKYSRLCNFWRSIRGPYNYTKKFHNVCRTEGVTTLRADICGLNVGKLSNWWKRNSCYETVLWDSRRNITSNSASKPPLSM